MRIEWFRHGKWPKWLVGLHHYTIASFVLLTVTGMLLYLPAVHTPLIPYLRIIYQVHILLGLIFMVTLLTPFMRIMPRDRRIWRLDWLVPILFGAPLVLTGVILWAVTVFPTTIRAESFTWHGILTVVFGAWILIHAFYKALGIRPRANGIAGRVDPDRRMFLKWLGTGLVGGALVTLFDPLSLLSKLASPSKNDAGPIDASNSVNAETAVQRFPAYYTVTNGFPKMTLDRYQLQVTGHILKPTTLEWSDIQALPKYMETTDFHCVTGWSVAGVHFAGVHLSQLVSLVTPNSSVKYVNFYSFDGRYTESLKLAEALDPSVLLAYQMDGQPIRQEQGFPLRLVVPKMFGYKSIKWVNRVDFSETPRQGYWEQYGYPNEAYFTRRM